MFDPLVFLMPLYLPICGLLILQGEVTRRDKSAWPKKSTLLLAVPTTWGLHIAILIGAFELNGGSFLTADLPAIQAMALMAAGACILLIYGLTVRSRKRKGHLRDHE